MVIAVFEYICNMLSAQQLSIIRSATNKISPTLVAIFGSFARGEEHANSDVDILIDFNGQVDLLELIGIEQELSEQLGFKVDLVTMRSVNKLLKPYIEADMIRIV